MTITTIILLLAAGILAVTAECPKDYSPIKSCCSLGFSTSAFSRKRPGVYTMMNFCGKNAMMLKFIVILSMEEEDG